MELESEQAASNKTRQQDLRIIGRPFGASSGAARVTREGPRRRSALAKNF
jgi:hypothetical protein